MAESEGYSIKIIEHCRVSPPPNSVPTSSLPLTFFDIPWLFSLEETSQVQLLFFHEFPHSTSYFTQNILPRLKSSLSLALQKFYPIAAKIMLPSLPAMPEILYTDGDSIAFTVAEISTDFHELATDHTKDVKLFHPLIPSLSPWSILEDGTCNIISDLFAMQVTLFPNSGLSLGFQFHHAVVDGGSFLNFLLSLGSIFRTGQLIQTSLPFLNRDVIEDQNGLIKTILLKEWSEAFPGGPKRSTPLPSYADVRATFHLSKPNIKWLQHWILNQSHELGQDLTNISSFAVVCAYTWVCLVKSKEGGQVHISGDQRYHFGFTAYCRNWLKTPVTYIGNCIAPCFVSIEKKLLLGQHGTLFAARAIVESAKELKNGGVMRAIERWLSYVKVCQVEPFVTVAGSPRFQLYNKDFVLGMPKKFELVHINSSGAISLVESKDEEREVEIGVALDKAAMDTFTTLFKRLESFNLHSLI